MRKPTRSPAELRQVFGANLKLLSEDFPSVSELARRLEINRTQFNRYLSGESFPRPDILARICAFFDLDARILLEPLDEITRNGGPLTSAYLDEFMGQAARNLSEDDLPSGFYRFFRTSFLRSDRFAMGLVNVWRDGECTYLRGYEARRAMAEQGIPLSTRAREYRGFWLRQDAGIAALISRRGAMTGTFNFLTKTPSFENNIWVGYAARTIEERMDTTRIVRMVYEYLGHGPKVGLPVARATGYVPDDTIPRYIMQLLQPGTPFK